MPKLKAGDTFVFTREMNIKKIASGKWDADASDSVGQEDKVACVMDDHYAGRRYCYLFSVVDDFLPDTTPKPGKDVWVKNVTVKLGEIEITENTVKLKFGGDLLSHEDFTKEYNLYRRVHNKLNQLKKNKDI